MNTRVQNNNTGIKSKQGLLAKLLAAVMLGYILTLFGNLIMWQLTSYKNTRDKLNDEYNQYLAHIAQYEKSVLSNIGLNNAKYRDIFNNLQLGASCKIKQMTAKLKSFLNHQNIKILDNTVNIASSFLNIIYLTFKIMVVKLIAVLASIALYVFAIMLGLLDGLVARYKRTMQAGRESTFVFHHVAKLIISLPVFLMFIYIMSPIYINPLIINLAIAGFLFVGFRVYGANLKKYM